VSLYTDEITPQSVIERVAQILEKSGKYRTRADRAHRKRFSRLLKDPSAVNLTIRLTDEVIRITSKKEAAARFREIAKSANFSLGFFNYFGIKIAALTSLILPSLTISIITWQVRSVSKRAILPAEAKKLSRHIARRSKREIRGNINVLGEAVLGEEEAKARYEAVLEMLLREEVSYISVKISSIISQIVTVDIEGSIERCSERIRDLYRVAMRKGAFVNLDMEEFRDLAITVGLFKKILDEPEFEKIEAGIVIQAYLPDSHRYFLELLEFSRDRFERSGGQIKIRLVKGANLAMEKAEAQYHGINPAPYGSKAEVDASYLKLVDLSLRAENLGSLRIGVASHNLFHILWALDLAKSRGLNQMLDIEMLEGMANGEALAIADEIGSILLYTPVTRGSDFPSAVAYLVRRLDENTSKDNYLRSSFSITPDSPEFVNESERFRTAVAARHTISTDSLRHLPLKEVDKAKKSSPRIFENESDGDFTNPEFRKKILKSIKGILSITNLQIPLVIAGEEIRTKESEPGSDPNKSGEIWYHYSIADSFHIDKALHTAQEAVEEWELLGAAGRGELLYKAGEIMEASRAQSLAVMARDAGKTLAEADPEITEAVDFARYYATSSLTATKGSTPIGVVVVVPPWNFPYAIPLGGICAALAAGNTVIFKPAPETVATAWAAINHLWQAGIPKNVLQFLPCRDDENGKYLVTHKDVAAVILTGGVETARLFLSWKPDMTLLAETSGKNAIVVTPSADLDLAVKDIVQSAFGHAGQKCSAASLAIVDEKIYDHPSFFKQLKDATASLVVGAGYNLSTVVGPIIRPPSASLQRALTQLDSGESWLIKPSALDESGYLWQPGIKIGVQPFSWSHQNEWFGPVLAIMRSPNLKTSLLWQNSTPFGLTAGIHSLNQDECELWIDQVEAGNLYVNRQITGAIVHRQPFGGWKQSSVGPTAKAGGPHYVEQLRNWPLVVDAPAAEKSAQIWWERSGSKAIPTSQLDVERNYLRYRAYKDPILVRVDGSTSDQERLFISWLTRQMEIAIILSDNERSEDFLDFALNNPVGKVRWLSSEIPPTKELTEKGISVDSRPLTQVGGVEFTRWLQEQSISITNHRYGNIGTGPSPKVM
jgi:RHH-type proline utilization regulon transcriptional repressor/proline dehydrogenase/delta 1-pyrroline-5-carboxylate dehydrogenase